jgi:type III secretory pathway component EscV
LTTQIIERLAQVLRKLVDEDVRELRARVLRRVVEVTQREDAATVTLVEVEAEAVGLRRAHHAEPRPKLALGAGNLAVFE